MPVMPQITISNVTFIRQGSSLQKGVVKNITGHQISGSQSGLFTTLRSVVASSSLRNRKRKRSAVEAQPQSQVFTTTTKEVKLSASTSSDNFSAGQLESSMISAADLDLREDLPHVFNLSRKENVALNHPLRLLDLRNLHQWGWITP